jgi:hypothetical protein
MRYREPRKPLQTAAKIHTEGGVSSTVLRSVSCSGAKAEGISPQPKGARIMVELHGETLAAKVMWSRGKSIGLKFDKPLNATALAAIHRPGSVSQINVTRATSQSSGHGFREMN